MAHLWLRDESTQWRASPLDGDAFALDVDGLAVVPRETDDSCAVSRPILLKTSGASGDTWLVISPPNIEALVNGLPLACSIRVVADRDEISVSGRNMFFSTETLASIESAPEAERPIFCPRCKQAIAEGAQAVRCPSCRVWHHQSEELPCWSYAQTCALCPHPTDLGAGYQWTPEEL